MKICILSDSHDHRPLLAAAVAEAKTLGAEAVLHCGDVCAPSTLRVLHKYGLPVHVIHGNNTGDLYYMAKLAHEPDSRVHYYGQDASITLAGRHIFLVHYPHYARALALTGDYDLVCHGHSHEPLVTEVKNIRGERTFLINPGTVAGIGFPPTYVMGDLNSMQFEIWEVKK